MAKFSVGDIVQCTNYRHCIGKNTRVYRVPGRVAERDSDYYRVEYEGLPGTLALRSYWMKSQFLELVEREGSTPIVISLSFEELCG